MHPIVKPDGRIDDRKIWRRDTLYKGMNGSCVERIYVTPSDTMIFKPLTNNDQIGREAWVYEHLLTTFPPIYPKLLARSLPLHFSSNWILFEDLGTLTHTFEVDTAIALLFYIAEWHALPITHLLKAPLKGPKPSAEAIRAELLLQEKQPSKLAAGWPSIPAPVISALLALLRQESFAADELVLSHGDLHLGNYAAVNGQVKVLDWEHTHLNSRYWDLFHVIDLSHPIFPKEMTITIRERLLDRYLELSGQNGHTMNAPMFKRRYYLFSCLLSLWMLTLIANDIHMNNGTWPIDQLKKQLQETTANLIQCAECLFA
ncbi:MAG TPA: phosphotransferase [Candidatus Udaeobacter sp.]|nr:phosphotransferase [Candidatus Udaeobacter sp.]